MRRVALWTGAAALLIVACGDDSGAPVDAAPPAADVVVPDARPDLLPPEFAGVKTAAAFGGHGLTLSWVAATDDSSAPPQIRYRAYVATTPGGEDFTTPDATSAPGATSVIVGGLDPSTSYVAVVRAVDQAGREEQNVVEAAATTAEPVRFASQVQPIFTATCVGPNCHSGAFPAKSLDLTSGMAYGELVGVTSAECLPRKLVAPGDATGSYLASKLRGVNICAGGQMPKGGLTLTPLEVQTVVDWIAEGAADN
jgi:hypothetical protein